MARTSAGDQAWVIRGPCRECQHAAESSSSDEKTVQTLSECNTCGSGKDFTLQQALKLLDSTHPITDLASTLHPAEDPRIVWLDGVKPALEDDRLSSFMRGLQKFREDLYDIFHQCRTLHQFFARPDSDSQVNIGKAEEGAADGDKSSNEDSSEPARKEVSDLPGLPRSLLASFKSIVALFSIQSNLTLLKTRRDEISQYDRELRKEIEKRRSDYQYIIKRILASIDKAQEDLILNITENNSAAISLGAVGPESIVAAAMMNVQKGALRLSFHNSTVTSPKVKGGTGGHNKIWTATDNPSKLEDQTIDRQEVADQPATNTSIDILSLYSSHLGQLELSASISPQRRVFLAIRALEDELDALHRVYQLQARSLSNLSKVLDPDSFRVTDEARRTRFPLENKPLEYGERSRMMDGEEIERMLDRAKNLRLKVKEDIEVMDEGHGKAIRVFTLVTLFFLPL